MIIFDIGNKSLNSTRSDSGSQQSQGENQAHAAITYLHVRREMKSGHDQSKICTAQLTVSRYWDRLKPAMLIVVLSIISSSNLDARLVGTQFDDWSRSNFLSV